MRRILVIPSIGHRSVMNDRAYQEFFELSEFIARAEMDAYWYILMPSWVTDGLRGHERMNYVYMDSTSDFTLNNVTGFPALELARQFSRRGGRNPVDAVLTDCTMFSAYLRYMLSDKETSGRLPVFLRNHKEPWLPNVADTYSMLSVGYVSSTTATRSVSESRHLSRMVTRFGSPAMSRDFERNSIVWPVGYDVDEMAEKRLGREEQGPFMFVSGDFDVKDRGSQRFIIDVARKLSTTGVSEVVLATTSPAYQIKRVLPDGDSSFFTMEETGLSRDVYRNYAVQYGHYFVAAADEYGHNENMEDDVLKMLLGQVGIFPFGQFVEERLGPNYPFLYNNGNAEEAYTIAAWVTENYGQAVEMCKPFVEKLSADHDRMKTLSLFWTQMCRVIDGEYQIHRIRQSEDGKGNVMAKVHDVATRLGEEFSLDVFLDVLEEKVTWLKPWGRKGTIQKYDEIEVNMPTLYDLRMMLDNLGWVDQCNEMVAILKKVREPLPEVFSG